MDPLPPGFSTRVVGRQAKCDRRLDGRLCRVGVAGPLRVAGPIDRLFAEPLDHFGR
ncbi:hypothetical protein AKJ09_10769 [Labilithrix luteola]|uniref:Uncharacterized protein n=1 Tax=Labilithrix luteola TaxID=1391654 RepID=A0A0K1QEA9_9BACT|nr:hypothetical protein AKJ09_10769 [Labilithrix luteola]